jgi:hypothetical protein
LWGTCCVCDKRKLASFAQLVGGSNNYVHFNGTVACTGAEEGWKELKGKYATYILH